MERDDTQARATYSAIAYRRIRQLILSGELGEGDRVPVRPLTELLDLSPTPIRAALAALERDGLLEGRDHRGYVVPRLSLKDILDVYEIREAVEGIASRRAALMPERGGLADELDRLLAEQRRCVAAGDLAAYGELDVDFHSSIWRNAGNSRLAAVSATLLGQVRVGNSISARAPGRPEASLLEHAGILEAIRAGDPETAEAVTRAHVRAAADALRVLRGDDEEPHA